MAEKMIEAFARINKRRQKEDMCIKPLTMFAEAWELVTANKDAEIERLRGVIKQAAAYSQDYADKFKHQDIERSNRHQARADFLLSELGESKP